MSAKAIVVDLNQGVAGKWYVCVRGTRFEKFYMHSIPLREVLHEACSDSAFIKLGVTPQRAVITEFDLLVNRISLEIPKS